MKMKITTLNQNEIVLVHGGHNENMVDDAEVAQRLQEIENAEYRSELAVTPTRTEVTILMVVFIAIAATVKYVYENYYLKETKEPQNQGN